MNLLRILLFPLALLYGSVVWLRNKFFDWGILPSKSFAHPLIGIGNLSTGGTGKTPHIEYLIKLLSSSYKVATLSRGYKRKTRGFNFATPQSRVRDIGDEPMQIYSRYPDTFVAVSECRRKGVENILKHNPMNQVILLDDVFQHRYVKPGLNILLTDYHKIFTNNYLLPTGNLREPRKGARRADALIVTKTPSVFSPLDRKLIMRSLEKYGLHKVFFSYIKYSNWHPITHVARQQNLQKAKTIFLLTGIANPTPLGEHLKRLCLDLKVFRFADHYQFKPADILKVTENFDATFSGTKAIITTEKDSMRLKDPDIMELIKNYPVYYVPIEVDFHERDKEGFDKMVHSFLSTFRKEKEESQEIKA